MPTMEELLKNKVKMSSRRHSSQLQAARALVLAKYATAAIVPQEDKRTFKLLADGKDLSNAHTSQHDCWVEAANVIA